MLITVAGTIQFQVRHAYTHALKHIILMDPGCKALLLVWNL
jgi:hypothetical protein